MQKWKWTKNVFLGLLTAAAVVVMAVPALAAGAEPQAEQSGLWSKFWNLFKPENSQETESDTEVASGICGENLTWSLASDGVLRITGQGEMENYSSTGYSIGSYEYVQGALTQQIPVWGTTAPWQSYYKEIQKIAVEEGVTYIGSHAFAGLCYAEEIALPESLTEIGEFSFYFCTSLKQLALPRNVQVIEKEAFEGCARLEAVWFPARLTQIRQGAFAQANNLKTLYYSAGADEWTKVRIESGNSSLYKAPIEYNASV